MRFMIVIFLSQCKMLHSVDEKITVIENTFQSGWESKGKLMAMSVENIMQLKNNFFYTKQVSFRHNKVLYKIPLRKYFLFHPRMKIKVNDMILREHQLRDMPTFYFGNIEVEAKTSSLVGRLHDRYFNGTLRYGKMVSFLNCHSDSYLRNNSSSYSQKYICVVYEDHEVTKEIKSLRAQQHDCASESAKLIEDQRKATAMYQYFSKESGKKRSKRSVKSVTCVLHLMADQTFFRHVGASNIANTVSEMVASVLEADVIFRSTDFSGNGHGDNIGFVIGNITLFTHETEPNNKFSSTLIDVYDYLNLMTDYDFSSYCLGIGFTHRDFDKGIVGLAWVANSNVFGPVGGICQDKVKVTKNKYKSYNTAIITYFNYGLTIPSQKSALTLTHELGHSFGSSHDSSDNPVCSPGGMYGSYIMDPYTNSGEKPNHRKFSVCSRNSMYPVIINKGSCFKRYSGPVCGNSVTEGTEECDCGTFGTCAYTDPCCTPSNKPDSVTDKSCTVRRSEGKVCSPKSSPCCTKTCQFIPQIDRHICKRPTDCSMASICDGNSSTCPTPQLIPNGTICDKGRKMCENGVCSSSICKSKMLEECQCQGANMCEVCCKNSTNSTNCDCKPASLYGLTDNNGGILYKHRGEPCNNFKGFCADNICISDDVTDIRSRLHHIFSEQNMGDVVKWAQNFWYYVMMVVFMLILTAGIYSATYQKMKTTDQRVEARRYGKLRAICEGANAHTDYFKQQIQVLSRRFDEKVVDIRRNREKVNPIMEIARLHLLFTDATTTDIAHVSQMCSSEELAVKMLLMKGYSMKKYNLRLKSQESLIAKQIIRDV